MRVEIRKLQRALGVTSVYVTHDQLEAMTLADMLVVMNKGRVEQMGPPLLLYEKPQTTFVAGFIGAPPMNLVEVPAGGMAGLTLVHPPQAGRFTLGIRPEQFELTSAEAGPSALVVDLTLSAVEAVGSETFLYGAIGGTGREIIVRVPGKADIAIGTMLRAVADASNLHFFDAESGDRLPD
jgi:sn-glycerol 3-phosphate transport system ATP-binding protein